MWCICMPHFMLKVSTLGFARGNVWLFAGPEGAHYPPIKGELWSSSTWAYWERIVKMLHASGEEEREESQPNRLPPHRREVKITSKQASDQAAMCPSAQFRESPTPVSAIPEDAHWFVHNHYKTPSGLPIIFSLLGHLDRQLSRMLKKSKMGIWLAVRMG